jgi:hypothetical protein
MTKTELIEALAGLPDDTDIVLFEHRESSDFWTDDGWETPNNTLYGKDPDELQMMKGEGFVPADCRRVFWFCKC